MCELVSIITPIYNSEKYLADAVQSVLAQSHTNWELLLINDGSTDQSSQIAQSYYDPRITYIAQTNQGVSAARNVGLANMKGDFFCFLDSDDVLPPLSLQSRINIFENSPDIRFVDGKVISYDQSFQSVKGEWKPSFHGDPHSELLQLKDSCFFGITWMIRREMNASYHFDSNMKFAEDLWFFIQLAVGKGIYEYTEEDTYYRRNTTGSASANMQLLTVGYHTLYQKMLNENFLNDRLKNKVKWRIKSLIVKSAIGQGNYSLALKELLKVY